MGHVILVRHGRAAARWSDAEDPGLSEDGVAQAAAVADALALFGPLPIYSSPKLRCQETAAPLAARWAVDVVVEPGIGEVQTPASATTTRSRWLDDFLHGRWEDQEPELVAWRDLAVATVADIGRRGDAVAFTHFVAINAIVGAALGDPRVMVFRPANCARTELSVTDDGTLQVVELGEAGPDTVVQ